VPSQHRLAGRRRTPLAAVADEAFVAPRAGIGLRDVSDELCAQSGFTARVAVESTEISTIEGLVAAGLGVAILPGPRPNRAEPGVAYVPLAGAEAYRDIGLIWMRERPQPAVAMRFADFVRSHPAR
jgi:LysR family transcriptional activator of glutamate synthase operon